MQRGKPCGVSPGKTPMLPGGDNYNFRKVTCKDLYFVHVVIAQACPSSGDQLVG